MIARRALPALAIACAFALAGCGASNSDAPTQAATTPSAPTTPTATVPTVPTATAGPQTPPPTETVPADTTPSPKPHPPTQPGKRSSCGTTAGHFIKQIQSEGVGCPVARLTARTWLAQVQRGTNPSHLVVAGYDCRARFRGERALVLCEDRGALRSRITFAAQP